MVSLYSIDRSVSRNEKALPYVFIVASQKVLRLSVGFPVVPEPTHLG